MSEYQVLSRLLGLAHVQVVGYEMVGQGRIHVQIETTLAAAMCAQCRQISQTVHETSRPQLIRDLPLWGRQCWLHYAPRRFKCACCANTFVEQVVWREAGLSYTQRYEQSLYERMRCEPIAQVAQSEGLSEEAAQGIFTRWAKKSSPNAAIRR
jgi:transposase